MGVPIYYDHVTHSPSRRYTEDTADNNNGDPVQVNKLKDMPLDCSMSKETERFLKVHALNKKNRKDNDDNNK